MTTVVISQPMYFPWVGMFEQMQVADTYVHYDDVQFSKGSFTNRVQIKTDAGSSWLTVPLDKSQHHPDIVDLACPDDVWRARHLAQFAAAYRGAPHLDVVLAVLDEQLADTDRSLAELLMGSMEDMAARLGALDGTELHRSSELGIEGHGWERVLAIVLRLGGTTYVTGHGASRYLDHEAFEDAGVEVRYLDYACVPYPQQHGAFTPYVSSLDLVANVGDDAPRYLSPRTVPWRTFTN